jgi:predicted MFS family arabinose efflux permease
MLFSQACFRMVLAVKSAALPGVLSGKDLLQANGLSQAGAAVFQVLGAGFGIGLGKFLPAWMVVVGGASLFVVASFVALRIGQMETTPHTSSLAEEASRVLRDIVRGLKEVAARPAAALGLSSFQMLRFQFFGFVLMVFALYARSIVASGNPDALGLALVGGLGGLGGGLGMVLAQKLKDRVQPVRILLASLLALGVATVVLGVISGLPGFAGLLFVGFFTYFLGKICVDTITQQAMPDDFRGRAFALFDIAYNLGFVVPAALLAVVWSDGRVRTLLVACGVVFLAVTALVVRWAATLRGEFDRHAGEPEPASVGP